MLPPPFQKHNKQNLVVIHDSDTTDMYQNDLFTSNDISESHDKIFEHDTLCNDYIDTGLIRR